jgi:hypothetical protein
MIGVPSEFGANVGAGEQGRNIWAATAKTIRELSRDIVAQRLKEHGNH